MMAEPFRAIRGIVLELNLMLIKPLGSDEVE